jgi:hypothetical protein
MFFHSEASITPVMTTKNFHNQPVTVMNSSSTSPSLSGNKSIQQRRTQSSSIESTEDPIEEFQRVTMLLSLLSSMNHEGRRVTMVEHCMIPSLERDLPPRRIALNALSILLVQGDEAVAVAMADHDIFSSGVYPTESSLHVLAMQDSAGLAEAAHASTDPSTLGNNVPLSAQPWSSLEGDHPRTGDITPEEYICVPKGTSVWQAVSMDPWSQR